MRSHVPIKLGCSLILGIVHGDFAAVIERIDFLHVLLPLESELSSLFLE